LKINQKLNELVKKVRGFTRIYADYHKRCQTAGSWLFVWFVVNLFFVSVPYLAAQTNHLVSFSNPAHLWGNGTERFIEEAYRQFFTTRIIDGKVMNIRLPFAMNNDRDLNIPERINIIGDGKGSPGLLIPIIQNILDSEEFAEYINALSSGREKVIIFDIPQRSWSISTDRFLIGQIKSGAFKGLPHRPHVLHSGRGAMESDVNNYLFCIGNVGVDCSGFVWFILNYVGARRGINLGEILSPVLGVPEGGNPAMYAGTAFFNSINPQVIAVNDEIRNLRPADIMLLRSIEGEVVHSAVIQSIDFTRGIIRYLQCNNVAQLEKRGVHESFIYFDPANPAVSLKDPSLHWTNKRSAPFSGEEINFTDDGDRYRHRLNGGGRVVRLRALAN